ncbi:uncharacterized protein LOC115706616 [Cannabis sativa]|uniref:uncharacterized protein LOC115706616 n=1 Tax=Cannabis sativa TaxID=3483 RepID=UPI0029C9F54B|nr:uncharacterized protein LOC115706616 [Cannabis sativa]
MASSSISFCHMNNLQQQRKPFSIERRPKLLKDFLNDTNNSCSSSGFNSIPRHQPFNLTQIDSKNSEVTTKFPSRKTRSKTSSSSSTTMSAIQAVFNAVKNIPFTTVKSPSFLPRSLSRKLSTKRGHSRSKRQEVQEEKENHHQAEISVKVKDILRWTSFRDLVEEISSPLNFTTSPHHYTTTTRSIDSSFNSSDNGSSWCESDFTEELLPCWSGNSEEINEVKMGKKDLSCVGMDSVDAITHTANVDPAEDREMLFYEEDDEQHSPVSVFDFELRENEEYFSTTFDQSLANVERRRQTLVQNINQFDNLYEEEYNNGEDDEEEEYELLVEEMARELVVYVKETMSSSHKCMSEEDQVLLDFFRDEIKAKESDDEYNLEMVNLAKSWLNREQKGVLGWGLDYNKEVYIREMHKDGKWSKFEVEQEELALEIEAGLFEQLIVDVLVEHL